MGFIVFKGEKKISNLLERAYGDLKPADAKRAEEALLRANPELKKLRELKPGALIVVPPLPGIRPTASNEAAELIVEAVRATRGALDEYRKRLGEALDRERAEVTGVLELLKSKELKAAVRDSPDAAPYAERVAEATKARTTEAEQRTAFLKGLAKAHVDLEALEKKLA
jgi:hypothetical protein